MELSGPGGNWIPVTEEPQKFTLLAGLPKTQHD